MSMTIRIALGLTTLLIATTGSAMACRGLQWNTSTLMSELPPTAQNEPVVARVEPIELLNPPWSTPENWKFTPRIRVRVVEAIKGVNEGQIFVVDTRGTSCDQYFERGEQTYLAGKRYYIAGQFEQSGYGDVVFDGAWKLEMRTGALVRTPRP
jgi:hypothetical protein